jgi:hypothetical protein
MRARQASRPFRVSKRDVEFSQAEAALTITAFELSAIAVRA